MRKLSIFTLFITLNILSVSDSVAISQTKLPELKESEWEYIGQNLEMKFYYNKQTQPNVNNKPKLVWLKLIFRTDTSEGRKAQEKVINMTTAVMIEEKKIPPISFYLELAEYDCSQKTFRARRQIFYDDENEIIESLPEKEDGAWKTVLKGSANEFIMQKYCGKIDQK